MKGGRDPGASSGAYSFVVLAVLTVLYVLNFLDRQLLSILAQPIKADLHLSDTELGLLGGFMFAFFYTTFGVPVAWLADRTHRVGIVAVACTLWSLFSAACGLATGFATLALARIGVGVGEAGGVPPSYAILSDYFPPGRRGLAMGLYSLGIPLGTALGGLYGGWAAAAYGWRAAFFGLAIPGVLLGILLPIIVREPARGRLEAGPVSASPAESPPLFETISLFFRSRTLVLVTLGCSLSAVAGYSILTWTPAYLMRVQGMSLREVGTYYSPLMGLSVALGVFGSGWIPDRLAKRGLRAYALVPAAAFAIALPIFIAAVAAPSWPVTLALIAIPQGLTMTYLAPAVAVVQNTVPAAQRSTASSLLLFVLNLTAVGGGPVFVGFVSDLTHAQYGQASLKIALYALAPFFLLGIACNLLAARSIGADARAAAKPEPDFIAEPVQP